MSVTNDLLVRIARGDVIVLDGGMGSELQAHGVRMNNEAWSAIANLEQPETVRRIHEEFIAAGADVIIANTFAAARLPLERAGYGDRVAEVNRRAVELARKAREIVASKSVAVAGSMSQAAILDITLQGRPGPTGEHLLSSYREQATALKEAGADLIVLEMITAVDFGLAAIEAAAETGLPVWLGVSVDVRRGDCVPMLGVPGSLSELIVHLISSRISAITVMHSVIEAVPDALAVVSDHWDGPFGTYPHHGVYQPPNWIFGDITPEAFASEAELWLQGGAQLIGGCCGLRPAHIRALRRMVDARGIGQ
jgi:S-methylmethionine-dependent homocysteine/selenocysteine methylase